MFDVLNQGVLHHLNETIGLLCVHDFDKFQLDCISLFAFFFFVVAWKFMACFYSYNIQPVGQTANMQ